MDLVFEIDDDLDPEFCEELIKRFEEDPRKHRGHAGGGYNPEVKSSIDLGLITLPEWDDVVAKLTEKLKDAFGRYREFLSIKFPVEPTFSEPIINTFQIQKSGFYEWHEDSVVHRNQIRAVTFIWYLNTVDKGGETDFHYKKVKPRAGKLVLFPATWTYMHKGHVTEGKYILTGWIYESLNKWNEMK